MTKLFQNILENTRKFHGEEALRVMGSAALTENEWIYSVRDQWHRHEGHVGVESEPGKTVYSLSLCQVQAKRSVGFLLAESKIVS